MKLTLVFLSLFVIALEAAPRSGIIPQVINGSPQTVQHAAAIFAVHNEDNEGHFGGGSIISDRHILTGANLVVGAIRCRIGYGATTLGALTPVETDTFVTHAAFNRDTLDNDIAIVFLAADQSITFSDAVRPIALPTAAPATGLVGSLAGWGYTAANAESFSDTLLVANLVTADNSVCTGRFSDLTFTTQFCANGGEAVIPGLISNICAGDHGAGFYTGDGFITTTPEPDEEDEEIMPEPSMSRMQQIQEEQVEPVLVGIASVIGNFWECNPEDPRGYTIVFNYLSWIRTLTGITA